jgi:hypothetical protein
MGFTHLQQDNKDGDKENTTKFNNKNGFSLSLSEAPYFSKHWRRNSAVIPSHYHTTINAIQRYPELSEYLKLVAGGEGEEEGKGEGKVASEAQVRASPTQPSVVLRFTLPLDFSLPENPYVAVWQFMTAEVHKHPHIYTYIHT